MKRTLRENAGALPRMAQVSRVLHQPHPSGSLGAQDAEADLGDSCLRTASGSAGQGNSARMLVINVPITP
jgi:hypothetical protein